MTRTEIIPAAERGQIAKSDTKPRPPSAVLRKHLAAHLRCRSLGPEFGDFMQAIARLRDSHWSAELRERFRAEAEALARRLPTDAELERARAIYAEAAEGQATRAQIGAIVGAMLDGLSTFSTDKAPGYVDVMLLTLETEAETAPFSAAALAGACYRLARSETWPPAPDAVVEAMREEQRRYASRADVLAHVLEGKATLRKVAA